MNCVDLEKLIPLYVGRDLEPRREAELREHLETCVSCRQSVAEFEESRDWLRGLAVPRFEEKVFEELRAAVHREAGPAPLRPSWLELFTRLLNRPAAAAALILLLLVTGLALYGHRRRPIDPPVVPLVKERPTLRTEPETSGQLATAEPRKPRATRPGRRPRLVPRVAPPVERLAPELPDRPIETAIAPSTDVVENREMIRIEIQTADPKIRIIWLAPKSAGP